MMREVTVGSIYRHFKGDYYLVEAIAKDCETTEPVVVYRQLYRNCELWIRSVQDFLAEVDHNKYPEVSQTYRFEEIHVDSVKLRKE